MKNVLTLNQVQRGVPAYDIMIDGVDCGVLTHFPHDAKAMATLHLGGVKLTLEAQAVSGLLDQLLSLVKPFREDIDDDSDDSNYDEDDIEYTENTLRDEAMYLRAVALGYGDPNF